MKNCNKKYTIYASASSAIIGTLMTALPLSASSAEYQSGSLAEARVLSAEPIYRTVRVNDPIEQCWDEAVRIPAQTQHHYNGHRSHTPQIFGAIVGAAIGNRFGSGDGRTIATVAGAMLGGSIGRDSQRHHYSTHQTYDRIVYEKRCSVVDRYHTEERMDGYNVRYEYNGEVFSTHMARNPGPTVTVSVNVTPIE